MSYNDDLEEWHELAFQRDQKGLFCTKRAPIRVKTGKKWRIKGGEWKQTAITTTTEKRASWKLGSGLFHSIPWLRQRSAAGLNLFGYGRGCQIALPLGSHCHSALGQKKLLDGKRSLGPTNHLPPRKCLNTISLLSHCSCLLCLSHMMFVCCLHKVQISWMNIYSSSVHETWKMSLFCPIPFLSFLFWFFFFWLFFVCLFLGVYTRFSTLFSGFQDLQGHNWEFWWRVFYTPNSVLRCAGKWIPLGYFQGNCIPTVSIAGVPRDGICIQSRQLFAS